MSDGKCTQNTSPHAHFSQCLASLCQFVCLRSVVSLLFTCTTRAWLVQVIFYDRHVLRASQQNILHPHIMSLLGVPTLSTFCSTPPPSRTPSPQTLTGIRSNSSALRQENGQFGPLATRHPTTSLQKSFVKNQIACLARIVLCERRLGRKPRSISSLLHDLLFSLKFFFCNIFSHNISLLLRRNSLVSDGKYTHNTSPHAHFSQCLASPCQFVTLRSVSSLFTCTTRACGSRYKLFFMINVSCAHPNKTFSIHTSCLSLVFRHCPLSVRLRHVV